MDEGLNSVLVSTAGLSVAALLALLLTVIRKAVFANPAAQRRLIRLGALAILMQSVHFAEELATGFYERFPAMLGQRPWSITFFASFNLLWIFVWGLSLLGLHRQMQVAFFPLWFIGIASGANALAHPFFAVITGGYFPGLWTSPLVGFAGVLLLRGLASFTHTEQTPLRAGKHE